MSCQEILLFYQLILVTGLGVKKQCFSPVVAWNDFQENGTDANLFFSLANSCSTASILVLEDIVFTIVDWQGGKSPE